MHTNSTSNYELSQFVGTDKPTFLGDYNGDMLKIDTAIAGVDAKAIGADSKADTAVTAANAASDTASNAATLANTANTNANSALATAGNAATAASAAQSSADAADTKATAAQTAATAADAKADAADAKAGDLSQLTTTAKTDLVAAINEVNAKPTGGGTASDTTYDNTTSGLTASNVQAAIDELAQQGGGASIIATAPANQTWAQQLTYLKTFYDALSLSQKYHAVLHTGANILSAEQTDGKFTYIDVAAAGRVNILSLHMANSTADECVLTTSASTTDISNNNNTNTLELIVL